MEMVMPRVRKKELQELRMRRGWPQEQLAEVAGISLKSVQRAESGKSISLDTLQALASALDVSIDYLAEFKAQTKGDTTKPAATTNPAPPKLHQLPRLKTGKAVLDVVGGAHTYQFDHAEPQTREEMELIKSITQTLRDMGDCWSDMEAGMRVESAFELTAQIQTLSEAGLAVFGKLRNVRYTPTDGKEPFVMSNALIVIQRADHPAIVKVNDKLEILPVAIEQGPVRFT